jgi:hypothetical protein
VKVKCNGCGYIGEESEFPKGRDFFQQPYVRACPKCDNRQTPGDASMRMMPGMTHPFEYVRGGPLSSDPVSLVLHNKSEAA